MVNRRYNFGPIGSLTGLVGITLTAGLAGCDDTPRRPTPPPTSTPATAPAEDAPVNFDTLGPTDETPMRAGYLTGRIIGPDGKPLKLKDARVEFQMTGVLDTAQTALIRFDVGPDGTYQQHLEPGTYTGGSATIEFPFDGRTYRMPLVPLHRTPSRQDASAGVVYDYVWKLSGLRPGASPEPNKSDPWLGGSFLATYIGLDPAKRRPIAPAPAGTTLNFTFTPIDNLANGQPGTPIVFKRSYDASASSVEKPMLTDVPLGRYRLQGMEERPDGTRKPILFLQSDGSWTESLIGSPLQDATSFKKAALKPLQFEFRRQED